ncbi:MAG: leucyl aminopeptidase [Actinobacteria bacterium]|uniref:leucyl aminopeptidase n=1 Tax=freshwater metagenome TaxID=449393 RepID=A0A6J6UTS7_9ZZZZ|nr:leucyl aminopeptidase [Actinomycetota bacterium]
MSAPVSVKIAKTAPTSATAIAVTACSDRLGKIPGVRKAALTRAGFTGAVGTSLVLNDGESTRVLLGLGPSDSAGAAQLRTAAAVFARSVSSHRKVAFEFPTQSDLPELDHEDGVRAVTEGLILGSYSFDIYKPKAAEKPRTDSATIAVAEELTAARSAAQRGTATAEAVCFARDLVNEPGGSLTPTVFADRAAERAREVGLTAEIMGEDEILALGLGGLIAVNLGSEEPARFLKLTYEPAAELTDSLADGPSTVALVGKGITFDSGGLSLKPAESMMEMKCDMAGAAAVIGAMTALASLGVAVRVISFTPMTDNMTGGKAQRPGDVYTARNGTTVEVLNTDAEGRLVLAEALVLACEEEPAAVIDLATLTGACMVALGTKIAGLMGNDKEFSEKVAQAAAAAGERVWELPLPSDYRKSLDSSVADLKNIGSGRMGGAMTAGLFLQEFVQEGTPWVHLDIAGPAFLDAPDGEYPKGGTGFGVRTLLQLLETWSEAPES